MKFDMPALSAYENGDGRCIQSFGLRRTRELQVHFGGNPVRMATFVRRHAPPDILKELKLTNFLCGRLNEICFSPFDFCVKRLRS